MNDPCDVTIVMCVEPGMLELKSAVSIRSLRLNGGRFANTKIWAFSPRPDKKLSEWMMDFLEHHSVTHFTIPLNTEYTNYPLANKPLCMAYAEQFAETELIVFVDGDTFFWGEPESFLLAETIDLALWPDGTKTVATSGPGDPFEDMWLKLFAMAGGKFDHWTTTQLSGRRVRGWWSSGIVVSRRRSGIMKQWLQVFETSLGQNIYCEEARYLREQMALCAAARTTDRISELPVSHNYPIQNYCHYAAAGTGPEAAVIWHYQGFLNKAFRKFSNQFYVLSDLQVRIDTVDGFIGRVRNNYGRMLGRDESFLTKMRRRLALGIRIRRLLGCLSEQDQKIIERQRG